MATLIGPYDYQGLIISYLHQDREYAKTASDRMSYYGKKLYSYNSVLAELLDNNIILIDVHIKNYSNTTSRQVNILQQFIFSSMAQIDVIKLNNKTKINWYLIDDLIKKYRRARVQHKLYTYAYQIKDYYNQILWQLDYYKIDKRTKQYKYKNQIYKQLFELKLL